MKRSSVVLAGVLMAAGMVLTQPVMAQQPTPSDDEVNELAREIYCPVCENTPLDVCPTKACAQWRELIREKMQQGMTDEEIKAYFASQYGDRVLAEPPLTSPFGLIHFVPPIIIVLSALWAFQVIKAGKQKRGEKLVEIPNGELTSKDFLEKVEDELSEYRKR